jgi:hypothetical protein
LLTEKEKKDRFKFVAGNPVFLRMQCPSSAGNRLFQLARLDVPKLGVGAATGHEVVVVPLLGDLAVSEDQDAVGVTDGGEAVGNDQSGAAGGDRPQILLDGALGLRVPNCPVMYLGVAPFVLRGRHDKMSFPAYLIEFQGAVHLAWTDLNPIFRAATILDPSLVFRTAT